MVVAWTVALALVGVGLAQVHLPFAVAGFVAQLVFVAASAGMLLHGGVSPLASLRSFCLRPASRVGWLSVAVFVLASLTAWFFSGTRAYELWTEVTVRDSVLSIVLAPLCEELFFRGLLLGALLPLWPWSPRQPRCSVPMAIYATAMLFLVFHLPFDGEIWREHWAQGAIPLHLGAFFLSIWTGVLVVVDRSLWTPVAAHAVANAAVPIWQAWLEKLS